MALLYSSADQTGTIFMQIPETKTNVSLSIYFNNQHFKYVTLSQAKNAMVDPQLYLSQSGSL